jgi:hypothetical protein
VEAPALTTACPALGRSTDCSSRSSTLPQQRQHLGGQRHITTTAFTVKVTAVFEAALLVQAVSAEQRGQQQQCRHEVSCSSSLAAIIIRQRVLEQPGLPLQECGLWLVRSYHGQYRTARPDALRHWRHDRHLAACSARRRRQRDPTGTAGSTRATPELQSAVRSCTASRGPNRDHGPRVGGGIYASTHAHLGTAGCGTRKGTVGREQAGGAA